MTPGSTRSFRKLHPGSAWCHEMHFGCTLLLSRAMVQWQSFGPENQGLWCSEPCVNRIDFMFVLGHTDHTAPALRIFSVKLDTGLVTATSYYDLAKPNNLLASLREKQNGRQSLLNYVLWLMQKHTRMHTHAHTHTKLFFLTLFYWTKKLICILFPSLNNAASTEHFQCIDIEKACIFHNLIKTVNAVSCLGMKKSINNYGCDLSGWFLCSINISTETRKQMYNFPLLSLKFMSRASSPYWFLSSQKGR